MSPGFPNLSDSILLLAVLGMAQPAAQDREPNSPLGYPGEVNPMAGPEGFKAAGKKVEKRLQALLATGRVIDVPPVR